MIFFNICRIFILFFLNENSEQDLWGTPTFFKMRNSEDIPKLQSFSKHYKEISIFQDLKYPVNISFSSEFRTECRSAQIICFLTQEPINE